MFACGGLVVLALIIFQKISACGGLLLFLFSQNFLALIIFKNPAKISFCFYYFTFKGGFLLLILR